MHSPTQQLYVTAPRSSYIAEAAANFVSELDCTPTEITVREVPAVNRLKEPLDKKANLNILRYNEIHSLYFESLIRERGMFFQELGRFRYSLLFSTESPLVRLPEIHLKDLKNLIEVSPGNASYFVTPLGAFQNENVPESNRTVIVEDRASMMEVLTHTENAYLWSSPISESLKKRYGLVQRFCANEKTVYVDVVVYRNDRPLNRTEEAFIQHLKLSAERCIAGTES